MKTIKQRTEEQFKEALSRIASSVVSEYKLDNFEISTTYYFDEEDTGDHYMSVNIFSKEFNISNIRDRLWIYKCTTTGTIKAKDSKIILQLVVKIEEDLVKEWIKEIEEEKE